MQETEGWRRQDTEARRLWYAWTAEQQEVVVCERIAAWLL